MKVEVLPEDRNVPFVGCLSCDCTGKLPPKSANFGSS